MNTPPRLTIMGCWHLGAVTAACCARHFNVTGLDFNVEMVAALNGGSAPLFEPGLNELIAQGIATERLRFTTSPELACQDTDLLWVCHDTPGNDADESDVEAVLRPLRETLKSLKPGTPVLISAQLPVRTIAGLEAEYPQFPFACSPENLRLGKAIKCFTEPERVIVGLRDRDPFVRALLEEVFAPFCKNVIFMRTESAEMTKHAINAYLALSIAFINEIARLCEQVGAEVTEVSRGLKSEGRIGPGLPLSAGGPFAGGTLARDVVSLTKLAEHAEETMHVIPSIKPSNDWHRGWSYRKLKDRLEDLFAKDITVLGLTYKPGTDTLRRSAAVELVRDLLDAGAEVMAYDPLVTQLPATIEGAVLAKSLSDAVENADAVVVCTEWPVFREADWAAMVPLMKHPVIIIDPTRFLEKSLAGLPVEHIAVGKA